MALLGFLHTAEQHVETFERLVEEEAPGTEVRSLVAAHLLDRARTAGIDDDAVVAGVEANLVSLADEGSSAIVCTCSTIGGVAEAAGARLGLNVVRVDRPMAETAVAIGGRVGVVAAVQSTIEPTTSLLRSVASERSAEIEIGVELVEGAWLHFERGDVDAYLDEIANALPGFADRCDVIVLAQASMAPAAERVSVDVPVLSSPRLAVRALVG
ncbi:MAG: aspartate/glutamate racemase family protein [Ilumatobacter sp.]|uniref:aspartate/glutamate racemase family protein n=1 Tax=Ilumatobacter sp. TaxID=1967498 RepID=UPI00260789FA|nr:aspartate/glutamate racemase family protein [Ilumatobacter sp.]MDJ0771077.1 aspartate/glutamate racemase family protein [Ilumatobacter sp.]